MYYLFYRINIIVKSIEALAKLFVIPEFLYPRLEAFGDGYGFSSTYNQIPAQNPCGNDKMGTFARTSLIVVLLVLIAFEPAGAASLSIDIGKESTSFGIGTDFYFGYGLIGLSTKFTTDAPWSYVQTDETLIEQCEEFIDYEPPPDPDLTTNIEPERGCKPKGRFFDGDEWEIFGKIGYRLPLISIVYLNTGLGVSKQKSAELYLFSEEYCTYWNTDGTCTKAEYSETWGKVDEDYFMTFLGGISVEMNRRLLFNLDYHSRKGLIGGLMWRY